MASTLINLVMAAFYGLVMFAYNWVLTAIGVFFAVLNVLILQWVERWREDNFMQFDKDWGKADGVAIAGIQSIETLKASAAKKGLCKEWYENGQVIASLVAEPTNTTGYKWSSSKGSNMKLTPGTTTAVRVKVEEQAPITFLLPFLREWSGIQ